MTAALALPRRHNDPVPLSEQARELASRPDLIDLAKKVGLASGRRIGIDHIEAESAAMMALILVARRYDPDCGHTIEACLTRQVMWSIGRAKTRQRPLGFRGRPASYPTVLSLDYSEDGDWSLHDIVPGADPDPSDLDPVAPYDPRSLDRIFAPIAEKPQLTAALRAVVETDDDDSMSAAARSTGVPYGTLEADYRRGLSELRDHYLHQPDDGAKRGRTNITGYRGVRWSKRGRNFEVRLMERGTRQVIGRYPTALEAAIAYDRAVIGMRLDRSRLNFPDGPPELPPSGPVVSSSDAPPEAAAPAAEPELPTNPPTFDEAPMPHMTAPRSCNEERQDAGLSPITLSDKASSLTPVTPANPALAVLAEVEAMHDIARTLASLDSASMARVLTWVGSAFGPLAGL